LESDEHVPETLEQENWEELHQGKVVSDDERTRQETEERTRQETEERTRQETEENRRRSGRLSPPIKNVESLRHSAKRGPKSPKSPGRITSKQKRHRQCRSSGDTSPKRHRSQSPGKRRKNSKTQASSSSMKEKRGPKIDKLKIDTKLPKSEEKSPKSTRRMSGKDEKTKCGRTSTRNDTKEEKIPKSTRDFSEEREGTKTPLSPGSKFRTPENLPDVSKTENT